MAIPLEQKRIPALICPLVCTYVRDHQYEQRMSQGDKVYAIHLSEKQLRFENQLTHTIIKTSAVQMKCFCFRALHIMPNAIVERCSIKNVYLFFSESFMPLANLKMIFFKVNGEYITACDHDDTVNILRNAGNSRNLRVNLSSFFLES